MKFDCSYCFYSSPHPKGLIDHFLGKHTGEAEFIEVPAFLIQTRKGKPGKAGDSRFRYLKLDGYSMRPRGES